MYGRRPAVQALGIAAPSDAPINSCPARTGRGGPASTAGSKAPKHVNARAKTAMMAAVDHHRKRVPQSQRYYEKKRAEGKRHNQAIRALGRHICRVIFKMLSQERPYRIDP